MLHVGPGCFCCCLVGVTEQASEARQGKDRFNAPTPADAIHRGTCAYVRSNPIATTKRVQSLAAKSLGLLSLPYFPWAAMDWKRYPAVSERIFKARGGG